MQDFGTAHCIVNNAGMSTLATVEHWGMEEIERVLAANLWGVVYGTKAFLPLFLKQKEACIVKVSSVFGLLATPCSAAYTPSKLSGDFERRMSESNIRQMITFLEGCAREIVTGLLQGKKRLLVGKEATALHWISRLLPDSDDRLLRKKLND